MVGTSRAATVAWLGGPFWARWQSSPSSSCFGLVPALTGIGSPRRRCRFTRSAPGVYFGWLALGWLGSRWLAGRATEASPRARACLQALESLLWDGAIQVAFSLRERTFQGRLSLRERTSLGDGGPRKTSFRGAKGDSGQRQPLSAAHDRLGLAVSDRIRHPVLLGVFRPIILIPRSMDTKAEEGRCGLCMRWHMARCYDHLFTIIADAVLVFWFSRPPLSWGSDQMRLDQEFLADHRAATSLGTSGS